MGHRQATHARIKDPRMTLRLAPGLFTPTSYPYPAEGVEILTIGEARLGERIWIGGVKKGVEVTRHLRFFALDSDQMRPQLFTALRALDGTRSIEEIARPLQIDIANFSRLLGFLEDERLIHFARDAIDTKSISHAITPSRREVEESNLPHGASFIQRSSKTIAITSACSISTGAMSTGAASPLNPLRSRSPHSIADPIAAALASLLFASGFEKIKFIDEGRQSEGTQITDIDLGLSIFNGSDIGASRLEKLKEIANRSAILPLEEGRNPIAPDFNATLTISIGWPRPDHHQRWVSEDRAFLIVPGYSQREIRIGPIIVPGRTPCLRCYELNQIENDFWREQIRQLRQLSPSHQPTKVASMLIASMTASYVTLWLDHISQEEPLDTNHPLLGGQVIVDLETMESRLERWQNHPECGCLWLPTHQSRR